MPDWVVVEAVKDLQQFATIRLLVDEGEASAIALCLEKPGSLLIMDERKGRKLAQDLGLLTIGTLGILIEAKKAGHVTLLRPLIKEIVESDFRVSLDLLNSVLVQSGEEPLK